MSEEFIVALRETGAVAGGFTVFAILLYRLIGGWRVFAGTYKDAAYEAQDRADRLAQQVAELNVTVAELKIEMSRIEAAASTREALLRDEIRILKEALNAKSTETD